MAKKNLRVKIPHNANLMIELANKIITKNAADGTNSPIKNLNMTDFGKKTTIAESKSELSSKLKKDAETAIEDRYLALGTAAGQQTTTSGTLLYYPRLCIRKKIWRTFRRF